jgi:hypothetical protein
MPGPPPIAFSVAHIFDMTTTPPTEVIYSIGGASPVDGGADPSSDDCADYTNKVVKIVNPSVIQPWLDVSDGVPQLNYSRKHMQVVIGSDGALYVMGGKGVKVINPPSPNPCLQVLKPERYEPPEVFASPSTGWNLLQAHMHDRGHHSVAGLLEDGRIYAAGGDVSGADSPGERSVEIYSPLYLFKGPRPVIVNSPPTAALGAPISIDAQISGGATGEFRVALLSPGSMTHGYNPSQRYIKLEVLSPDLGTLFNSPPALTQIQVQIPSDPRIALPGYYLLTVVRQNGVPSVGKWIRIG